MLKTSPLLRIALSAAFTALLLTGCTKEAKKARLLSRAEEDFRSKEYDKARLEFLGVLRFDSQNPAAFQRLGQIWLEEGAPLRAAPFLLRAKELAPGDANNQLRLARVYSVVGRHADATKEVFSVLQQSAANGDALVLLTEIVGSAEEIRAAEEALQRFSDKESSSYHIALGNVALHKQDLAAAGNAIHRAVELAPKSPEAHQAMGILHLLQKNPKQAGEEFKVAAELAPVRSSIQTTYAEYKRQNESSETARVFLEGLVKKAPDFLSAWTLLSRIAFSEKKYDEALKFLDNIFSRDPENVDARLLQSDSWLAKHESKKVSEEMERLDKTYPGFSPFKYRLAQACLQENKLSQAGTALDQAITANPDYTEAILLRAELNLRTGHAPLVITALEELLKKRPNLKPAQLLLADAYRAAGRLDDVASIFREQIQLSPTSAEPYFFLGLVQQQQRKNMEARQSFEKVLELSPDKLLAVSQLIELDLQTKDLADASRRVQEQLEKHPDAAVSHVLDAKVRLAQGSPKEAEAALKKAIELDPNFGPAYDLLVTLYLATNRLPEAIRELEAVLSKAPKNESALMTLGVIQEKQKDYPKASEAYEKLLAFNPNFIAALNNLAYLYAEQLNQLDKARELAQKARALDPGNPAVADTLGWALYKRGDYEQALTLLQESAGKLVDNPESQFHLGMIYYMMGQADPARAAFQRAMAAPGDFPSKAEAESRLALLGDASGPNKLTAQQLEEILKRQPNDLVARLRLAEAEEKAGAWAKAAEAYEAALKLNSKLPSATLKLAQIYSGPERNKEKALAYAKQARALSPDDPKATAILGRIAFETGDFSWAYDLLQESSRQFASDPKVLHDLAWAAYSLGKTEEARSAMQRCRDASPDSETMEDSKAFLFLTALEADAGGLMKAKSVIDAKLKAEPKYVPALVAAAALALQTGAKTEAIQHYQEVLQRFPEFVPAQTQLALLYSDDPAHAAEAYSLALKARKALPDDPVVAQLLGQLSYQKKDYPRALQLLQESAAKKPLTPTAQYYLGLTYKEQKRSADAAKILTEALKAGLPTSLAPHAKETLAELEQAARKTP